MDISENEKVEFFCDHQVLNPRPLRLSVRNGQKVQVTTTGFEPVTLHMMVSIVTTRPTNIDVDEL